MSETVFSIAIFRMEIATICFFRVTIHGLYDDEYGCVMLACKQPYSSSYIACEAGTPHKAADRSIADASYVQSTDDLRLFVESREQTQRKSVLRRSPSVFPYSIICMALVRNQ